jgi:hypothetical protein
MAVMELNGPFLQKTREFVLFAGTGLRLRRLILVVVIGTAVASTKSWKLHRFEISWCSRSKSDVHLASVRGTRRAGRATAAA